MIKSYECMGRVGNTLITKVQYALTLDAALESFSEYLEFLAYSVLEYPEDWECIRVRVVL